MAFPINLRYNQTLFQLNTSKSKGPDGIPTIVLKTCAPELAPTLNELFQLSYTLGTFSTSWKQACVLPIPKKLIHSTILPMQSFHSYLKQWRPSSLNNFLPLLKQTVFSLITSMDFEKPDLLAFSCLCCPCLVLCSRILRSEQGYLSPYL